MGWLPSFLGGGSDDAGDPLGKLDPKLREFLEKESPVKYSTNGSTKPPTTIAENAKSRTAEQPSAPAVPNESLYQDGRYAHLWKNYKPLAQVESENATDQEKVANILEAYKDRKALITKVAMENCAILQEDWINCMKHGGWEDRLQMCRHQVRKFERCYTMQSRLLRALGYASVAGRSVQVEEDIQMHADALYQRVLSHETAVEQAKKDGIAVPTFEAVFPNVNANGPKPSEETKSKWNEVLDKLPAEERVIEEAALRNDLEVRETLKDNMVKIREERERQAKAARGGEEQQTIGGYLSGFFTGGK